MPIDPRSAASHRQRLIRRVLCVKGQMTFRAEVEPRFDYGRVLPQVTLAEGGAVFSAPGVSFTLSAQVPVERTGGGVRSEFTLAHGESATFYFEEAEQPHPCGEEE